MPDSRPHFRPSRRPFIIGHRGSCGALPEHTLEGYARAIEQGADAIELDLVPTRDGALIARHENELSLTTNVARLPQFRGRCTKKIVEGTCLEGWFSEDFTLAEIRSLRARQRLPFRDASFDGRFRVPTLDDVVAMAGTLRTAAGNPPDVYLEIKHPSYFESIGLPLQIPLDRFLRSPGPLKIWVQSFEVDFLRRLRERSEAGIVQLLAEPQTKPADFVVRADPRTFGDLITPAGLKEIAAYADGIGPWKRLVVPAGAGAGEAGSLASATQLINDAHGAGLFVCAWTFRDEPQYLASDYGSDPAREYEHFRQLGLDGFITDFPATARNLLADSPFGKSPG